MRRTRKEIYIIIPFKVGFLVGICLPCYEMLKELLPHTVALLDGARYLIFLLICLCLYVSHSDVDLSYATLDSNQTQITIFLTQHDKHDTYSN